MTQYGAETLIRGHLYFMPSSYCRIRHALRMTPAMQTGMTDQVWKIEGSVDLLS